MPLPWFRRTLERDVPFRLRTLALAAVGLLLLLVLLKLATAADPAVGAPDQAGLPGNGPMGILNLPRDLDPGKVALGELMFEDPRLSGSGKIACSTCHDLRTNGTGPRRSALDTPTVFNAALNFRYGWKGDHRTLEGQALATLKARIIAQGVPFETIVQRLRSDPATRRAFREQYGRDPDAASLMDAIATFERSLVTPDSRFDRWLAGDSDALSAREQQGYTLFQKLGCSSCHQGRNVGGNLYQRQGIFRRLASPTLTVVRVPSLRNVATTAPYFHDGSAPDLEAAIGRMARAQLNRKLSQEDIGLVAAYLRTLTGTYRGAPVRAPS